jgi:hypothetical protein
MTPQAQVEALMNEGLGFAEHLLAKHGEFFPFAISMHPLGETRHINVYDANERPSPQQVIDLLIKALCELAKSGESKAIALIVNTTITRDGKASGDAVQAGLEHQSGYCVNVLFPYSLDSGALRVDDPFALSRDPVVFR